MDRASINENVSDFMQKGSCAEYDELFKLAQRIADIARDDALEDAAKVLDDLADACPMLSHQYYRAASEIRSLKTTNVW